MINFFITCTRHNIYSLFLSAHAYEHSDKIGDQPDKPDKEAEFMEILHLLFVMAPNRHGRPYCMKYHQYYCKRPCHCMKYISRTAFRFCYKTHCECPRGITQKSQPEYYHMAFSQYMCMALRKHTNCIEYKCQCYCSYSNNKFYIHISAPFMIMLLPCQYQQLFSIPSPL